MALNCNTIAVYIWKTITETTLQWYVVAGNWCVHRWERLVNTSYSGGISVAATTVAACQNQCLNNLTCTGVDFNPSAQPGQRCWIHGTWSGGSSNSPGISHYRLQRAQQNDCPPGKLLSLITIAYHAWNTLPDAIRRCSSPDTFKRSLKTHLYIQTYF